MDGLRPLALPVRRDCAALFGFSPLPLQVATAGSASAPGIFIVEGPMGCGKTEAALAVAYALISSGQGIGLHFALPTQTTSNRIHRREPLGGRWHWATSTGSRAVTSGSGASSPTRPNWSTPSRPSSTFRQA